MTRLPSASHRDGVGLDLLASVASPSFCSARVTVRHRAVARILADEVRSRAVPARTLTAALKHYSAVGLRHGSALALQRHRLPTSRDILATLDERRRADPVQIGLLPQKDLSA